VEVSRASINPDELVDFPINERFLKLPVDKFFENEGVELIPPQIGLINAVNDPQHRFVVGCLSRRTGKTFSANHIAFLKALEPGTQILIISPNYSLSNISWAEQQKLINKHEIGVEKMNAKDKEIILENGSLIKLGSVSQANSCVGRSYDLILFDEAALDSKGKDAFNIQLRPTLDKENSKAIFISTPRGTNYFHEFYMRGFEEKYPFWASIHSTWRDNPRTSQSDIDEAKLSMSNAEFRQEYEADFTTFEGQIYEGFDEDKYAKDLSGYNFPADRFDAVMGIDAGYKDPTAAVKMYYDFDEGIFYLTEEYLDNQRNTEQHAKELRSMMGDDADFIFCDSAAAQFRHDLAELYDIPSNPSKKSKLDGIAYVQSLIDNGRLIVDIKCRNTLDMLANYRWDPRPELLQPKPIHNEFSHIADALRYALYSFTV